MLHAVRLTGQMWIRLASTTTATWLATAWLLAITAAARVHCCSSPAARVHCCAACHETDWPDVDPARFDHHCDVVGNCVAAGNHRWFILLLITGQAAAAIMLYGVVWRIRRLHAARCAAAQ